MEKDREKVVTLNKFSDKYKVTDASEHESQPLDDLLTEDDKGQDLYAKSAYRGEEQKKFSAITKVISN